MTRDVCAVWVVAEPASCGTQNLDDGEETVTHVCVGGFVAEPASCGTPNLDDGEETVTRDVWAVWVVAEPASCGNPNRDDETCIRYTFY